MRPLSEQKTPGDNDLEQAIVRELTGRYLEPKEKESEEASFDYGMILDALRKRLWLIALVTIITPIIVGVYTSRQPKLYQAQATLVVNSFSDNILNGVQDLVPVGTGGFWGNDAFYEKERRILGSRSVARRAGENIGILTNDKVTGLSTIADEAEKLKARAKLDPADFVLGRYSLEQEPSKNIIHVKAIEQDPQLAADVANGVADAYTELNLERRIQGTNDAGNWLSIQHMDLKRKLEQSEADMYAFMEENAVLNASLDSQLDEILQRLTAFNKTLASVQAQRIENRLDAKVLSEVKDNPDLLETISAIRDAPIIAALKAKRIELDADRSLLSSRYKTAHPKMKAIDEQIQLVNNNLDKEVNSVLISLKRQQASLAETEAGLKQAIQKERQKEASLNKLQLQYNRLKREVETNEKLFGMITTRLKEAGLTGALRVNNVMVLERALTPASPFKPNVSRNVLSAILLGLLAGIGLAIGASMLDNTIKNQEDIEKLLKAPFLGLLPSIAETAGADAASGAYNPKRDMYVFENPKSAMAECARFIRTNLLFMSPDKPIQTMTVTSPSPQEGKTTMSVSLSIVMAQSGSRTLLIDTDLRKPRLHRALGLSNDVGVSSIIAGQATIEEAIHATDVPGLDILVCGPIPPNPAEIFHTDKFHNVLKQLQEKYDRIICDSPPVGAVTDPVILSALTDGTILVTKSEKTSIVSARQSLRALSDANTNLLGVVLNDVNLESRRYGGYYYQYYRRYGQYYGETTESSANA